MVAQTQLLNDGFSSSALFMPQKELLTNKNAKKSARERAASRINTGSEIVEVYMDNFYKELEKIEALAQEYNFIAMVSFGSVFNNLFCRTQSFQEMCSMAALRYV